MENKIQIYFIDSDPSLLVKLLIDEHISSQIMNCVRILCNAHRIIDGIKYILYDEREVLFYKIKQIKNPWSKWCRKSVQNYLWISDYLFALLDEYKSRFNKKHRILSFRKKDIGIPFFLQSPPHKLKEYEWTNPPLIIPDNCLLKHSSLEMFTLLDIINSYRYLYKLSIPYIAPVHPRTKEFQHTISGND
jgi:hypothetical protein